MKMGTELYTSINMYSHINLWPMRMKAYENKTYHMFNRTTDDEPLYMYARVCV